MKKRNKKKKIKRTPEQMKKIYEKQRIIREISLVKKSEEIRKREIIILENVKEIVEQLTDEDKKDMWFHLTPTSRWEKIKDDGLRGGVDGKWGDDKGYLYLVDSDCKKLWNGISSYHLGQHIYPNPKNEDERWKTMEHFLGDKDYVVIGVPKKVFEILECEIGEDMGFDLTNYNQNHKVVTLGNKKIHPSLLTKVYQGMSDINRYETKDRWEFLQKYYKRIGKDIPKRQLELTDVVFGWIRYEDRKIINTKNFFNLTRKKREQHLKWVQLQKKLGIGKQVGSPRSNTSSPFVLEKQ